MVSYVSNIKVCKSRSFCIIVHRYFIHPTFLIVKEITFKGVLAQLDLSVKQTFLRRRRSTFFPAFFRKVRIGAWREELTEDQVQRIVRDHREVMRRFGYLNENKKIVY